MSPEPSGTAACAVMALEDSSSVDPRPGGSRIVRPEKSGLPAAPSFDAIARAMPR